MTRLGELTKQHLLNVKKISDAHTYKLNFSLESHEVHYVSSSVHKGKSLGKSHDCWKLRVKRTRVKPPFQWLCSQFHYNLVCKTCWADQAICYDYVKKFRYSHLQTQFFNTESRSSLNFSISSYVSVSSHKGKSLDKSHECWKMRVRRIVVIPAALQPIPTQFSLWDLLSWPSNMPWLCEEMQIQSLTNSILQ